MICRNPHNDPMLKDVLSPELLLDSDLEEFSKSAKTQSSLLPGNEFLVSTTPSKVLSLLSFIWFRLQSPALLASEGF
jgi:hypothetical protein